METPTLKPPRLLARLAQAAALCLGLAAGPAALAQDVVRIGARIPSGLRTPTLLVFSAIDNLVKGAAGQAIQNANLMLGLEETAGLPR